MFTMLKWTGAALGMLAGACLASHRAKLRRQGNGSAGREAGASSSHRSDVRQPDTHLDAGGQTA